MSSVDSHDAPKRTKLRLPGPGVLLVVALLMIAGGILLALRASRSGIRRVEALGGRLACRGNILSDFVTDQIDIDRDLLSTDGDVGKVLLKGPKFTDDSMSVLRRFRPYYWIEMEESNVTDDGLDHVADPTGVIRFWICDCPGITDAGIAKLARLPKLGWLRLEGMPVTGEGIAQLVQLKKLDMDRCPNVDNATLEKIGRLPNLTRLSVQDSAVTDAGLQHLAGLTKLSSLDLSQTQITDGGLRTITETCPGLTWLSLDKCKNITDEGILELADLKSLQMLFILDSNISPEAVAELQASLPKCDIQHR